GVGFAQPSFGAPVGATPYGSTPPYLPTAPAPPTWPAPGITGGTTPYAPYGAPYAAPYNAPYGAAPANPYGANPYAASPYGTTPYGSGSYGPPFRRLFQDTGFRYTWLPGAEGNELEINEVEVSTTAFFPHFLRSNGPLRVTPGFAFDFLDGPSGPGNPALPAQLYSAYLDFGWAPEFNNQFSADVSFRSGVYSDFDSFTTHSLRMMGTGLGVVRITPTIAAKLGATYIDRARIKVLPVAGILWQPNPQTRWDILFPSPKLATYWTTIGNSQVWWYLGGEYGGGSWTFRRDLAPNAGAAERADLNDIRVFLGIEWQNLNRWYGFIEGGYVFDREIYYVVEPSDRISLNNTWMLRAGLSF
ncbi:MAG: hypothetical protein KDA92_25715, partial [Planctomycetales bacterium]|nr:hypothetical protein [Planctomycetales bacterium]